MHRNKLISSISPPLPSEIAEGIVDAYIETRQDVATGTLGRVAPGKFVEKFIQALQFLETTSYDQKPSVDFYLKGLENRKAPLDDGLRLLATRIARSIYGLRSKRNIAHIGTIDPNSYDLQFLLAGSKWILAELIRNLTTLPMEEAGKIVDELNVPVDKILEAFEAKRIVLYDTTVRNEILLILHSVYPDGRTKETLINDLDRRNPKTVAKRIRELWNEKLIEDFEPAGGYKLTQLGYSIARKIIGELSA